MPTIPAEDPKITIKDIIDVNISVKDDQSPTPVAVVIETRIAHLDTTKITKPTIIIEKEGTGIEGYSLGYAQTMLGEDYSITCYALDLNDSTNVIKGDSLLYKMSDEIKRIFLDRTKVVTPKTDISIIQYLGGDEGSLPDKSPRFKIGVHLVRVRYQR